MTWRLILGVLAAASLLGPLPSTQLRAEPFGFRGLALGTPLSELRRLRFPEAASAQIICTHDPEGANLRPTPDFMASIDEIRLGVIACGAFTFARPFSNAATSLPAEWLPARISAVGLDMNPVFWFVPGEKSDAGNTAPPRLYRITMRTNSAYWQPTKEAFIRRYGPPAKVAAIPFTGYRGARLDNEQVVWSNAESTITLTKRDQLPNRLFIVYEHATLTPAGSRLGAAVTNGEPTLMR